MVTLVFHRGLCGHVQVSTITLSPLKGEKLSECTIVALEIKHEVLRGRMHLSCLVDLQALHSICWSAVPVNVNHEVKVLPVCFAAIIMSDRKAVIKNADMSEDMQQDAVDCATQALEKYNIEKDIAAFIKKEFDKKYNPTWHCIVGRNFGSYVTHETKHFIYFYLGQVAILLFKSG